MEKEAMTTLTDEQIGSTIGQIEAVGKELQAMRKLARDYGRDRKEFTEHLTNALRKDLKTGDHARLAKMAKGIYNLLVRARTTPDRAEADTLVPGFVRKAVETFVILLYASRYLGYKELDGILSEYGVNAEARPLGDMSPYMDGLEDTMRMFVKGGVENKNETEDIKERIDKDIYTGIPPELQNEYGISRGTFRKLYMLNFVKNTDADNAGKRYESIREEANRHTQADSVTNIIADNVMEEVKKNG